MTDPVRTARCTCGKVVCQATGRPILSAICYCDDCREAGLQLEALPGAPPCRTPDGGAHYMTYRDDRFRVVEGADLLKPLPAAPDAKTQRLFASCCNSAMFLKFAPGHWTSSFAIRHGGDALPVEMRTQVKFRQSDLPLPEDAPAFQGFGPKLFWRLFTSRLAMLLRR